MKNIFKISMLLLAFVFETSCSDEYEAPYGDYSSFKWYTNEGFDESDKILNINSYVAFMDLSRNTISNEWAIPEGAKLLNSKFTTQDSVYDKFIIGSGPKSTEKLINVLFTKPGLQEVKLFDVFKEQVEGAAQSGKGWFVEKIFTVDVFANPNPEGKVFYNGEEVFAFTENENPSIDNKDSWPVINIEAGEALDYVDMSKTGRISGRRWTAVGGKPETKGDSVSTIVYNKLGEFTATLASVRNGAEVPSKTVVKNIPLRIKVNASTKPFVFNGGLKMDANEEIIRFAITGEAQTLLSQEGDFTVHVVNTTSGFDADIDVESAQVSSTDGTIIELKLAEPVYNTDEITVSYSGGGIKSVDERTLLDFGPEMVNIALGSSVLIDTWASFEDSGTNWKAAFTTGFWAGNANGSGTAPFFSRTEEMAIKGTASMKYTGELSNKTLQGSNFSKPNGYSAGTYNVSYKVYLEADNTMKAFRNVLQTPFQAITWDLESLPRGVWVKISQVVVVPSDIPSGKKFDIKIEASANPGVTGVQTIYFDDLQWVPLIDRP
jgi:hypothetical protein